MNQDPQVRQEAHGLLSSMFQRLGHGGAGGGGAATGGGLGGMAGQLAELAEMPLELSQLILDYATQLTELTLSTLEEGGLVLIKGLTPA